jgi:hypothetical protein
MRDALPQLASRTAHERTHVASAYPEMVNLPVNNGEYFGEEW